MREYRGKSVLSIEELNDKEIPHKNGWVYGWYVDGWIVGNYADSDDEWIAFEWWSQVIPETVGQFTGLHDKNGVEIYEGDVVLAECCASGQDKRHIKIHKCEVRFSLDFHGWRFPIIDMKSEHGAKRHATGYFRSGHQGNALEVIGNIHNKAGDE